MPPPPIQELEKHIRLLQHEVGILKEEVVELQKENAYLRNLMETISKSTTTLIVAVKGDTDYHRKGLVDDIRDLSDMVKGMKAEIDGFTTLKNKATAIIFVMSAIGTSGLALLAKTIWAAINPSK